MAQGTRQAQLSSQNILTRLPGSFSRLWTVRAPRPIPSPGLLWCWCRVAPVSVRWALEQRGPQLFWHQGPVSWKTIFPQTRVVGWGDGFGMTQAHYIYRALYFYYYYIERYNEIIIQLTIMLTGGGAQVVMREMGSSCKYRCSFTR